MIKSILRKILTYLKLDLTKNLKYDRLSKEIMSKVITKNSNCIDIGCHKGEILDLMINYAPEGNHIAFEPIPSFYNNLVNKYKNIAKIYPFALSEKQGTSSFQYVKNAPAYSGIKKRKYDIKNPEIEEVKIKIETLDNLVDKNTTVDFIKLDVEGAEFNVLKGAKNTIQNNSPYIVFEFGLGASDYYNTKPEDIYNYLVEECNFQIFNLSDWIKKKKPLTLIEFKNTYNNELEYYFIAQSKKKILF